MRCKSQRFLFLCSLLPVIPAQRQVKLFRLSQESAHAAAHRDLPFRPPGQAEIHCVAARRGMVCRELPTLDSIIRWLYLRLASLKISR
jgi:hypothetical protein